MRHLGAWALAGLLASGAADADAGGGSGTFSGQSGHQTSGSAELVEAGGAWEVRLGADFDFDGAPDPYVGFGQGGSFVAGTDFEVLRANSGAQVYSVPTGIDPSGYDSIVIWCRKFSVPLGTARLQ